MSYVLEALRKSEQERQVAAGVSAGVLHPVMLDRRTSPWRWMIATLLGIVLLTAAVWWFWPRSPIPRPVAPPPASLAVVTNAAAAKSHSAARPSVPEHRARTIPPRAPVPLAVASNDLPAALLGELPPLVISGFIQDEQAGSMVVIDDKLLREGDEVASGLRLEKILGDGAQFSYKGYLFRR